VTVPAGQTLATFNITVPSTVADTGVAVTATFPSGTSVSNSTLAIKAPAGATPTIASVTANPSSAQSGITTITVTLSSAAPGPGGSLINISLGTGLTGPATLAVPAGLTVGTMTATVVPQPVSTPVTVNATYNGSAQNVVFTVAPSSTSHTVTVPLVDVFGNPRTNVTGLTYYWFDQTPPNPLSAPINTGTTSTDGAGKAVLNIPNTTLTSGQTGFFVVLNSDGTLTQNPVPIAASGIAVVD
jgi:hypothetical protein